MPKNKRKQSDSVRWCIRSKHNIMIATGRHAVRESRIPFDGLCVLFLEVTEVYSPYNPYGYLFPQNGQQQPFMPGMQPSMQQPMQSPIQAHQHSNSSPVVMQVPSIKQVEQAPVQPGGKALVLVANEPVIAMRTADNMGLTTTDYYHIEKFDPDAAAPVPAGDFVPRAEFNQTIQTLLQQIQQLQKLTPAEKEGAKK